MWRKLAIASVCTLVPAVALAHLCNDVFVQAKDNLAVKVDVRDGQLRIGQEASFKVYLLNTMDRDIAAIALSVTSDQFTAEVSPKTMMLKTAKKGGKKESFEITLKRNPGVADGKYKIELCLFNPKNKAQVFKTMDMDSAAGIVDLPKGAAVKIDGNVEEAEWGKAPVCTDFYTYGKKGKFDENVPCQDQARIRVSADADNVYCLLQLAGGEGASSDELAMYASPNAETAPVAVTFDRLGAKASCDKGTDGIEVKAGADKNTLECKVPRALLGIKDARSFHLNFARTLAAADGKKTVSYWHGNSNSLQEPIVYGQFRLAE